MSSEALSWAFRLNIKPSSVKFTLVAMCECANYKTGRITPSIAHLCEITGQDRKTVITNIAELEKRGLIVDTGDRCGATKQIKVYGAAMGTVPKTEQSQKRNSSENGRKQSQKRDTEPSLEPSRSTEPKGSSERSARDAPFAFPCPPGVDDLDWQGLKANRKAKRAPMTAAAHRQIVRKLDAWNREGWPPGPIVANAAEKGWLTVFETDEMKGKANGNQQFRASGRQDVDRRSSLARAIDEAAASLGT